MISKINITGFSKSSKHKIEKSRAATQFELVCNLVKLQFRIFLVHQNLRFRIPTILYP
jgi:hypothetical protein